VTRGVAVLAAAGVLGALTGSAGATESTIIRGVGIGKVRMGMTRGQVERLLGRDSLVDARSSLAGASYVELGWNFSTFSVGFLGGRVMQVETTLRGEKTAQGIGVGSLFSAVVRAYPQAICTLYFTTPGVSLNYGPGGGPDARSVHTALVVAGARHQLAFLVETERPIGYGDLGPVRVKGVIVRNSVPASVDFPPNTRCAPGWQKRGRP
jgi:hypothetical protein